MKKVLLTGGSGFVGSFFRNMENVEMGFNADLRIPQEIQRELYKYTPDDVIHLAAQSFVPASFDDPIQTFDINFMGTFNLLRSLKISSFTGRLLYIGSADTYGKVPEESLPVFEDFPLRPQNPYAVSKVAAEALCYQWSQTGSFTILMARPFNHVGPGQNERFVVSNIARQITEIKLGLSPPVLNVGEIDVTRDFTDVRDVIRAYNLLLENGKNGEIYNVCSGIERSVRDIIEKLCNIADVKPDIVKDISRIRPSDQRRMKGSFEKLHEHTGWKPAIPFDNTLKDILDYWETKLK